MLQSEIFWSNAFNPTHTHASPPSRGNMCNNQQLAVASDHFFDGVTVTSPCIKAAGPKLVGAPLDWLQPTDSQWKLMNCLRLLYEQLHYDHKAGLSVYNPTSVENYKSVSRIFNWCAKLPVHYAAVESMFSYQAWYSDNTSNNFDHQQHQT